MKKTMSIILTLVILVLQLGAFPFTVAGASTDSIILSGNDLLAAMTSKNTASANVVTSALEGKTYVKFVATAGQKPEIYVNQSDSGINLAEYPYWVISYYQSQNSSKLDTTFRADLTSVQAVYPNLTDSAFASQPSHPAGSNGTWTTVVLSRDNFWRTEGCTPTAAMTGQNLRFKPWTSSATEGSYFALEYFGLFSSESAAQEYIENLNKPEDEEGEEGEEGDEVAEEITVFAYQTLEYGMVYEADNAGAIKTEVDAFANLVRYPLEIEITANSDSENPSTEPVAKEIVIGNTSRPGTANITNGLGRGEYRVKYDKNSKRIFIVGGSTEDTISALWYFYDTYFDKENKILTIPSTLDYKFEVDHIILGGEDLLNSLQLNSVSDIKTEYDFAQKKVYVRVDPVVGANPEIEITQKVSGINMAKYPYWVVSYLQSQKANNLDTSFYADKTSVQAVYGSDVTAYSFYINPKPVAAFNQWKTEIINRDNFILSGYTHTPTKEMTGQKLRFKPWQYTGGAVAGSYFLLEYVAFFENEQDATAFVQKNWNDVAVESLEITNNGNVVSSISVMEGSELELSFISKPIGSFANISVTSDNTGVVDIVNGKIKAIDDGEATLTVKANEGISGAEVITKTINVTVMPYRFESIAIDGVDIGNYKIVIPENCDLYTKYAAELLSDYISSNLNCVLDIVTDDVAESTYEILIGNTNRSESSTGIRIGTNEYVLAKSGNKVVMSANGLYTSQSIAAFINEYVDVNESGAINITTLPKTAAKNKFEGFAETAENVIIMIGDGMGYNHINMALDNGLDKFVAQDFPVSERQITRHQGVIDNVLKGKADPGYTDSAAAATALSTGYKTLTARIGMDKTDNPVDHVSEIAYKNAKAEIAVVTTDVITGATPAGFLVHNVHRQNEDEMKVDIDALVESGMLDYSAASVGAGLTDHTKKALKKISENDTRFFAMIEDGGMDSHGGVDAINNKYALSVISNVKRFNDAIAYVSQFVILHPNTALIVTADHETGGIITADSESSFGIGYIFTSKVHTNRNVPLFAFGAGVDALAGGPIENIDVARFMAKVYGAESFGQSEELPVVNVGDVDADGKVTTTDSVTLSRYLANWSGYENLISAEFCNIDSEKAITTSDSVMLARHLANWTGYETLPYVG